MGKVYKNNSRNEEPIKATKDVSLEQIMKNLKQFQMNFSRNTKQREIVTFFKIFTLHKLTK